jgi:fibronectin-binding autotransporter adhesin
MRSKYVAGKRSGRVDSILIAATAVVASASHAWAQATSLPSFNANNVYNVTVANSSINSGTPASTSTSDNSTAINAYISYVSSLSGGGTVLIPAGTFDSNTITMRSNVNLELASGAVLTDDTPANTLIQNSGSANMEISGSGTINGGATTTTGSNKLVYIQGVTTLEVTGVSIENAAQEHLVVENDTNVTIKGITIADPVTLAANGNNYLANTDGIDYSGTNFTIENSNINDGDDDIVAKTADNACANILITNDTIGAGHGISVGGGSADGLKNMTVSNITFNGTNPAIRLKAEDASGSDSGGGTLHPVVNVVYSNIVMTNVVNPIVIDSFYNGGNNFPSSATQTNHAVDSTTPMWENIGFSNITVTGTSGNALFYDLNTTPSNLEGMSFNNVTLDTTSASKMWWGTNINLSGLTANQSLGENDLTNVTAPGPVSITWNNTGASVGGTSLGDGATWDIVANQNWNTGTSFTTYTDQSNVTFNDSNNGHYAVTLSTTVSPLSTTINNSSGAYTISGAGTIAGTGSLTKTGTSTATISTSNAYTGGTIINGGTLAVGSVDALGALETLGTGTGAAPGGTSVNASGSLDLNGRSLSEPITLNGGTLTNSNAATASVVGGVKGIGYTTTTPGIGAGSTITFSSGTAAATPIFGITAASFTGFMGTYTKPTSTINPPPQAPNVLITSADGNGSGALAYADLTGNTLTGITIVNPGSGYDMAPDIQFIGGNGSGGVATGNANYFTLVGIQVTASGSGYTSAPLATLHNNGMVPGAVTLTPVIGSVTLESTSSIGGNAGNISLGLPITGAGGLIKTGSDTLALSGVNSYGGGTAIANGTLQVGAANTLPTATTVTFGTVTTNGVLDLNGESQQVGGLAVAAAVPSGSLPSQIIGNSSQTSPATLVFDSAESSTFGGVIVDAISGGNQTTALTVNGGSLTFTNANTYSGTTTINGGTLLAGAANSLSPNSSINVAGGTLDVSAAPDQIPGLTVGASGTLNLAIGNLLTDTGTASFGGTLNVSGSPSGPSVELMSYTSDSGTFANVPTFVGYNLVYAPTELELVAGGPANLTWTNASSNNLWDTASSSNWNNGTSTTVFNPNDNVTFNDNNPSNTPANYSVTLNTTVTPGSVTVNNSLGNYTISGSGTIAGGGSLTKSGTGTLTLATANVYTGGTNVSAGTLVIEPTSSTTSALPTGALSISGSGIVQLADNVTAGTPLATSNVNLTSLSLTGSGTLDIGNNRIIIDYSSPATDPIASIEQWIANGFYGTPGPSIISSDITADDALSGLSYGIGYADGADGVVAGLPSGEIEIMFTLLGDANLDGTVNSEDFSPFSSNLGGSPRVWDEGDFNYDGTVNSDDFSSFSHNLGQTASLAASTAGVLEAGNGINLTNVPEPTAIGLLTLGLVSVLARRRRRANP